MPFWSVLFQKKEKVSQEERERKYQETLIEFDMQITQIEKEKKDLIAMGKEARAQGLPAQEKEARSYLAQCLKHEKQIRAMKMQMQFMKHSRTLAGLAKNFMDSMATISEDICGIVAKTNPKAEKAFIKANESLSKQVDMVNSMLETGDAVRSGDVETGVTDMDIQTEIDALLGDEQAAQSATPNYQYNKNNFNL